MMINYYSIYDKDMSKFAPLFPSHNDAVAKRQFVLTLKGLDDLVKPRFVLERVLVFDDEHGTVVSTPDLVCSGEDYDKLLTEFVPKKSEVNNG